MATDPVRAALYGRLNHSSIVGSGLATGVYHPLAPSTAAFPYVVFHKQDGRPMWSMADHMQWDLWTIKAVDRSPSAATAETIAAAIKARLLDAQLTITGSAHLYLRWTEDLDYYENDGGELIHHVGQVWRLVSDPN